MAVDLAVAHSHAPWWPPDLKPQMEASPSATAEGADGNISAWVADESNRISGQELTLEEGDTHADLVQAGKSRELAASENFDVIPSCEAGKARKQIVQTRWVLTWKMADGKKCVKARLVAKGFQGSDLKEE